MNEVAADENSQTFLLHTGDWNNEDTEYKWDRDYFNTTHLNALELKSKMSVMGSRGNHEGTGSIFKKYWPYDYPGTNTGFCHFMDYGPVHVCFIDLQTEYSTLDQYKKDWIESDLSSTEKDWKVLVFHSPLYSNGGHVNNIAEQEYLQSLCINYGVQIVLCGHNHYYAHWLVNGIHHLTSGGGGAETNEPTTGIGEILADNINHFIKISIVDDLMNVNIIDYEGNHIEDFTLPRSLRICNNVHITWNEDITYADKIRICAGSTLSINANVSFVEGGGIIIEAGGKLELIGGTLTSANPEMPWQGIEVWGDPLLSQIPANQGWLVVTNGGTIENAEVAVRAGSADYTGKGGGIVSAEDAVFLNNTVSAMFDPYTAYTNTSAFGSCTFNYTKTISGEPELYFAKLNNVISVQFNNCTFTNNSNQDNIGVGIESINSIFSVEGLCTEYSGTECIEWDNGLFENLEYGVYATASTTTRFTDIRHTTFTNNFRGIYLSGMTLPRDDLQLVLPERNGSRGKLRALPGWLYPVLGRRQYIQEVQRM
jgi:predicted phosphodiesterase